VGIPRDFKGFQGSQVVSREFFIGYDNRPNSATDNASLGRTFRGDQKNELWPGETRRRIPSRVYRLR
jgi:hypothetical protein